MNPARCRSDRFSDIFQKRDDVVISFAFRCRGSSEWKTAPASESPQRPLSESGKALPSPHRRALQFPARFQTSLVRPDFAHLCPGITVDHGRKIRRLMGGKAFSFSGGWICEFPARIANWLRNRNRSLETGINQPLSKRGHAGNARYLNAHLAAVQKIRNAATISLLLSVHELTARIRSPSKSRLRGLMIWRIWAISFHVLAIPLSRFDAMGRLNISSIFTGRVIQSLSTFRTDRSVTLFVQI